MPKQILTFFIFLFASSILLGQENSAEKVQDGANVIYRKEFLGGFIMHTQGFGINAIYRLNKTYTQSNGFQFQLVGIHSWKRIKTAPLTGQNSKSYVYGKKNSFFVTRLSFHHKKTFFEKRRPKGVSIDLTYDFGLSIGYEKPYYLKIIQDGSAGSNNMVTVEEPFDETIHSRSQIFGRSSFFKGFGEIDIHPGGFGKIGLMFDWAKSTESISGVELGLAADVYANPVEIMAENPKNYYFITAYVNILFGKKLFY